MANAGGVGTRDGVIIDEAYGFDLAPLAARVGRVRAVLSMDACAPSASFASASSARSPIHTT